MIVDVKALQMSMKYEQMSGQERYFELQKEKTWYLMKRNALYGDYELNETFAYPLTNESKERFYWTFKGYGYDVTIDGPVYEISWKEKDNE